MHFEFELAVHGCFGSAGQFRGLAQVLAFNGQQSACFTYDDRAELTRSASDLRRAVNQLAAQTQAPKITVIGHSQGALVARKSLTELPLTLGLLPASCYLVTGAKWADITDSSRFILEPGVLVPQVSSHLKIDTDERGSCRREKDGRCLEDDAVFIPG